ncbi:MAG TPA: amidohydrolase family protein [Phenylobacterium sp.]|uniref:amidohydrolase family protein n=1 Tax=Phenylobacterium sp. TaxID=1871053 RepID=UPI002B48517D|nr:amidohydrolase family protein [Phenylobacterium sp.]HKR90396.1 amidohydrolase family protein [Phenylobacterium sp.]
MNRTFLFTGGFVATMDDTVGDFADGAVLVDNGVIKAVGPASEFHGVDADVIDAGGGVIMPGMIDTHRHTCAAILPGVGADHSLLQLINNAFVRYFPPMSADDLYVTSLVGALEAIDNGVTTVLDCCEVCKSFEHAHANMQALVDSGIRGFFSYGMNDEQYPGDVAAGAPAHAARLADVARLHDTGTSLMQVAMGLSHPGTVPFEETETEIRFAQRRGMLCCSHTGATKHTVLNNGVRERADRGLMLPGHVYIHCPSLTHREWQLIADTGGKVSIAPETEMQMAMGIPPFRACMDHGVKVSLSTDTVHCGSPDLLSQMRLGLQLQRCLDNEKALDQGIVPTRIELGVRDALIWGTRNGADALGLESQIGTLAPGKTADIVVVKRKRAFVPSSYPLGTTVLHANGGDVDTVMIAGEIRKRDGVLVGIDLDALRDRAKQTFDRLNEEMSKLPPEMSEAELDELLVTTERTARINFARAYLDASSDGRSSWRSDPTV